ncbi:MAG: D-amino acid aminotransferase [Acidobacteria bacterium]|jgi:branched-chain amino acid aminotransferase|nr:D-amino acid aminotransferase [Acidobacteriota bacterium]
MGFFASINGEIVPLEEARVPVLDNGFLFGDSVYEVLRTYGGRPFESGRHFRRMRASADRLGIAIPVSDTEMLDRIRALLTRAGDVESYVRIVVTRGVGDSSYDSREIVGPTVVMIQKQLTVPPERHYSEGVRVCVVDTRRNHPQSLDPAIKSSNLLNNILALREARARGAEEPVLSNLEGFIAEGASTNVFVVKDGALLTPPLSTGILGGITREVLLELAESLGIPRRETALERGDLLAADEAFLSSTTREVMPIRQVDDTPVGDGHPGPVTRRILEAFRAYAPAHCD